MGPLEYLYGNYSPVILGSGGGGGGGGVGGKHLNRYTKTKANIIWYAYLPASLVVPYNVYIVVVK